MFVGHYAVSFAARSTSVPLPLWVWFVAVQWLDVVFMTLVLAGVEKVRITQGFTESNDLDLYYMPFSHGLVGALLLSVIFAAIVAASSPAARRPLAFGLLALASFSHWLLDLLVHTPDLPVLDDDSAKLGLGIWEHVAVAFPLELVVLALGVWIYARWARSSGARSVRWVWVFALVMAAFQAYATFTPTPSDPKMFAVTGLFGYVLMAAIAAWVERRTIRPHDA